MTIRIGQTISPLSFGYKEPMGKFNSQEVTFLEAINNYNGSAQELPSFSQK